MESLQNIKRRIKGIGNINQITKAMELVAAAKMRKSQELALNSRPYAFTALDLLGNLSKLSEGHPIPELLAKRDIKRRLFVVITSDKGLAGAFNSAVIRQFERYFRERGLSVKDENFSFIAIGQKAAAYLERRTTLAAKYLKVGDFVAAEETEPIARRIISGYLKKDWDEVYLFATHFNSALRQTVIGRGLLPVDYASLKTVADEVVPETGRFAELIREKEIPFFHEEPGNGTEYLIEPSPETVLEELVEHLIMMRVYHIILEANASEHAARRMAMKKASDNAQELAEELTLEYNKSRQAAITKEIIEITSGVESLK